MRGLRTAAERWYVRIPSSSVCTTIASLKGPLPWDESAATAIVYGVNLSNWPTTAVMVRVSGPASAATIVSTGCDSESWSSRGAGDTMTR